MNAGHEGGLIVSGGGSVSQLESTGPLISPALGGLGWEMNAARWESGSLILLYTDGLSEAAEAGEIFGPERITSAAREGSADAGGLLKTLLREVGEFTGGKPPEDDITLLAVQGRQ